MAETIQARREAGTGGETFPPKKQGQAADWRAILTLALLTLLFFWKMALDGLVLAGSNGYDTFAYFYPYRAYTAAVIRAGHLPLWNPFIFMGVPLLANVQAAVFYPLNVLYLLLPTPQALSYSVVLHIFLAGLGMYAYARLGLRLRPLSAFISGAVFCFSGFFAVQSGHINQLNVATWIAVLFLCFDLAVRRRSLAWTILLGASITTQLLGGHSQESYVMLVALSLYLLLHLVLPLPILAQRILPSNGHLNTWLGTIDWEEWTAPLPAGQGSGASWRQVGWMLARDWAEKLLIFGGALLLGFALAAAQLLPTAELTRYSIRSGGLSFDEAMTFALPPNQLAVSLLPGYLQNAYPLAEFVAYIGILGLILAGVALLGRKRQPHTLFFLILALVALLLATGPANPLAHKLFNHVPGFNLFRVPARWLYLYVFALAALVGLGSETLAALPVAKQLPTGVRRIHLGVVGLLGLFGLALAFRVRHQEIPSVALAGHLSLPGLWVATALTGVMLAALAWRGSGSRVRRISHSLLLVALLLELFAASRALDYNHPTLPEAYTGLRPVVTYLLANQGLDRNLTLVDSGYDPGDERWLSALVRSRLPAEDAIAFVQYAKYKDSLGGDLPMVYQLPGLDGYDGGVLPLKRFAGIKQLFVSPDIDKPDAVLRNEVHLVPDPQLLGLFNVKYILIDRRGEVITHPDNVFYDTSSSVTLTSEQGVATLQPQHLFPSTAVQLLTYLSDTAALPQGTPVAEVVVTDSRGMTTRFVLHAGVETAEGNYSGASAKVQHRQPAPAGAVRDRPELQLYVARLAFAQSVFPARIALRYLVGQGSLTIQGASLFNAPTDTFEKIVVSPGNALTLEYVGDLTIYRNHAALPRAFLVHAARTLADDAALEALRRHDIAPGEIALVAPGQPALPVSLPASPPAALTSDNVQITSYAAERVEISASSTQPGMLLLMDSFYPGWQVTVDGKARQIWRVDTMFRGVPLPVGTHRVVFIYDPPAVRAGLAISALALLLALGGLAWSWQRRPGEE